MNLSLARFALVALTAGSAVRSQDAESLVPPGLVYELMALNGDLATVQRPRYLSPDAMALSPDSQTLYVAEQTAKQIAVVSLASGSQVAVVPVPNDPTGLAVSADGAWLYVTCSSDRWPNGTVCEISTASRRVTRTMGAGHMARGPVLSADGSLLYTCNWLENTLSVIDLAAGSAVATIPVGREPYAAALTRDGNFVLVSCVLPDERSTSVDSTCCKVRFVDTRTRQVAATVRLPVGSHSAWGVALSPDGRYAFVSHLLGRFRYPATQLSQGQVHSNNVAIIDVAGQRLVNDVEIDDANQGYADPWGVACNASGTVLCVLHAGANCLTLIDLPGLVARASSMPDLSGAFSYLANNGLKRVVALKGRSPRNIVVAGTTAYIASRFSDSLDVVGVAALSGGATGVLALGSGTPMTMERTGEWLYQDAGLCYQNWQSCFSCHPSMHCDGLNWILSQSLNNAPKNVRSHVFSWQTPRTGWDQRREGAWESIEKGIQLELQTTPTPALTLPLDTFLMRLKPVASPFLIKGRLGEAADRGRTIFVTGRVDCSNCHPRPLYWVPIMQESGILDPWDPSPTFDTPTLLECWRTAPYSHIGDQLTIRDMAARPGVSYTYFRLTAEQKADLLAFIESL